jgi:uncharacterized membrane protein YfcA
MRRKVLISLRIGAAAGMLAGLTGVGGGVFLVPLMVGLLAMAQHQAHGTSLAVMFPIALVGAITYAIYGHILGNIGWEIILGLALGGLVGVVLGARLMMRVPARHLRWMFGTFLVVVGTSMIMNP